MSQQPGSFSIQPDGPATYRMRPGEHMSGERPTRPTYVFTINVDDPASNTISYKVRGASFVIEHPNLLLILNASHEQVAAFLKWDSITRAEQSDE